MTTKHLACVLLGLVILGLAFFTNNMKTKMSAMQEEADNAERLANDAQTAQSISTQGLTKLKKTSEPIRAFLGAWTPHVEKFRTAEDGETQINSVIKRAQMIPLKQAAKALPNGKKGKGAYVSKKLSANMSFEDDYVKCLEFLGRLEEDLPSSRIAHCKLTKGQGSNTNVNMELVVELPMTGDQG